MTEQENMRMYGLKIYLERKIKMLDADEKNCEYNKNKAAQDRCSAARRAYEDILKQLYGLRLIENGNGKE